MSALKDLRKEINTYDDALVDTSYALELIDTAEDELAKLKEDNGDKDSKISRLEDKLEEYEENELDMTSENVGLDTISFHLEKGNLAIRQHVENFIKSLQKKYIGVTSS